MMYDLYDRNGINSDYLMTTILLSYQMCIHLSGLLCVRENPQQGVLLKENNGQKTSLFSYNSMAIILLNF